MNTHSRPIFCMLVSTLSLLAGCASPGNAGASGARPSASASAAQPTIELLGFTQCPSTPAMRANLRVALLSIDRNWTYTYIDQDQLPENDLRRGWPAPTVLVNGRDLFAMTSPTQPNMTCRVYDGGLPSASELAGRIKAIATTPATASAR